MIAPSGFNQPMYDVLLVDSSGAFVTGIAGSDPNLRIAFGSGGSATVCAAADIEAVATLDAYQAPSAGTKVRWREVSAANFPGQYQIHLPAASHASTKPIRIRVYDTTATPRWVEARGVSPVLTPSDVLAVAGSEADAVTLSLALQDYDNFGFKSDVAQIRNNVVTASSIASGAFTAAKFASGAFDAVWSVGTRTLTSFGSLVADIWNHATRTLTSIADSSGVTTLLSRLTSGRATNLDKLDATVSSRLAASSYAAPPTAAAVAGAVWDEGLSSHLAAGSAGAALNDAQTPQNVASEVLDALTADHAAAGTVGAAIGGIKAKTDQLTITGGLVDANIEAVNNIALQGDGSSSNKWRPV